MSSTKRECKLHKGIGPGFCLLHGLYCCPSCHLNTHPDCSVSNIDHAAGHLQQEIEMSAAKIHNALQSCKSTKTTLHEQFDDAQQQCDEAIEHVTEFCEQLQSTIEIFRQLGIEIIRALTANRTDTIKEQQQKGEELEDFLTELNDTLRIDDTSEGDMTRNVDQKSSGSHIDLVNLNTQAMDIRDGLAQVESNEWVCKDDNFSIFIHADRSINEHLANQLNVLCDSIGKTPEGCAMITSNSDRRASPPQASWMVQSDTDNDVHSFYSGAADGRDNRAHKSFTEVTKGDNRAPESFTDVTQGDNLAQDTFRYINKGGNHAPDSFREVTKISHPGSERVVRFARSSTGLYILIASKGPCKISKVDEKGRTLVTEKTNTKIHDMFVRGEEVFAAANDRTIKVYRLEDLRLMRQIPTSGVCRNIVCTDHDLVVTFLDDDDKERDRVCRLSDTGHQTHESSCKITRAWALTMTSDGDKIILSDYGNKILVLSADLKLITKVRNREIDRPRGLCVVGESVFVACRGNDSVIELDRHGRYKRNVLDKEDCIVEPHELSYDAQSRKLVLSSYTQSKKIIVFVGES